MTDRVTVTHYHKPKISLIITDLDNTLYDWISSFVPSFYAMVNTASEILSVPTETLLDELRAIHQRHGSTEHPYALLETGSVVSRFPGKGRAQLRDLTKKAFDEFNKTRNATLRLYEGVSETLAFLGSLNVPVVAYTDARVQNCLFRMSKLGLVPFISRLYAPQHLHGSEHPGPLPDYVNAIPANYVRELPATDRKPNPETLLDICGDFSVNPSHALYIGDSLVRDVHMAQAAGLHNAWARYGTNVDRDLWARLVRITHWTADDVAREDRIRIEVGEVSPESTVDSFAEVLGEFQFVTPDIVTLGRDAIR